MQNSKLAQLRSESELAQYARDILKNPAFLEYAEHRRAMILNDMAACAPEDAARCSLLIVRLQEFNRMLVGLQRFIETGDMADTQLKEFE